MVTQNTNPFFGWALTYDYDLYMIQYHIRIDICFQNDDQGFEEMFGKTLVIL